MIGCDWKPPIAKRKRSPTTSHGGEGAAAGGGEDDVHNKDHDANPDKIKVYSFYLVSGETVKKLARMQGNREAQKGVEFGMEELGAGVSWHTCEYRVSACLFLVALYELNGMDTYGVASISRLLEIIGLFFAEYGLFYRALLHKRPIV